MSSENSIKVTIFRYDPSKDSKPRYETYNIPRQSNMTVLGVLRYVYENYDGTLAFNYECRNGYCGGCAVWVNKTPQLICKTPASREMIIEPLRNLPLVKDLIVDRSAYDQGLLKLRPFLERATAPQIQPEMLRAEKFQWSKYMSRCTQCLSCYSVCPVLGPAPWAFAGPTQMVTIGRYAFDPRDSARRNLTAYQEGVYNCVSCLRCNDVCPSQIPIFDAIRKMREQALDAKIGPIELFKETEERLLSTTKSYKKTGNAPSFLQQSPDVIKVEDPKQKVAFFVGCTYDMYSPRFQKVPQYIVEILRLNDVEVLLPKKQMCCGLPIYHGGLSRIENIAERNCKALEATGVENVIVACPGCGIMLKNEYPQLLGRKLKFQVKDINEYLANDLALNTKAMKKVNLKVTYHDPCHLSRGMGVSAEPRKIIQSIPGIEFVEMDEPELCCGGGGMVRVTNLPLARTLAEDKAERIKRLGVDAVVTSCPFCKFQLEQSRLLKEEKITTLQVIELLASAYGI